MEIPASADDTDNNYIPWHVYLEINQGKRITCVKKVNQSEDLKDNIAGAQ